MTLGSYAVWVFVGSSVVIVFELVLAGLWSVRLARHGRALAIAVQQERGLLQADLARLQAAMEETRVLWRPYARALRWLRHPLTAALLASYWRRWSRRRR